MSATPYTVILRVEQHARGERDWFYSIHVNRHCLMTGDRKTRSAAKRALRSQLKQLQHDIDEQLADLK